MDSGYDVCGIRDVPWTRTHIESAVPRGREHDGALRSRSVNDAGAGGVPLGVTRYHPPANTAFVTLQARLRTFQGWPRGLSQRPEELAKAGFYYEGRADHVKCFSCDGGLCSWEPEDSPEIEHRKWFPDCAFVSLNLPSTQTQTRTSSNSVINHHELTNLKEQSENIENNSKIEITSVEEKISDPKEIKLKKEIQRLRDDRLCKICLNDEATVVFLPCGHLSSCTACASALKDCPVCRAQIQGLIRAYLA